MQYNRKYNSFVFWSCVRRIEKNTNLVSKFEKIQIEIMIHKNEPSDVKYKSNYSYEPYKRDDGEKICLHIFYHKWVSFEKMFVKTNIGG